MDSPQIDVFAPRPCTSPGRGYYHGGESNLPQSPEPGFPTYTGTSISQRSIAVQAAPTPWTRYFFPQQVGSEDTGSTNPFFQYFDVRLDPEQRMPMEQLSAAVPSWVPDAYHRLSFVQMADGSGQKTTPSEDITQGDAKLMRPGGEDHLSSVTAFCRSAAQLRARSWRDAEPLTELLGGLVLYLLDQLQDASRLAAQKMQAEFEQRISEEQAKLNNDFTRRVEAERALLQAEQREEALRIRSQVRIEVEEEFGSILKMTKDNVNSLAFKVERLQAELEEAHRKLKESADRLEASEKALSDERAVNDKLVKDAVQKEGGLLTDLRSMEAKMKHLQSMFIDAVKRQEGEEIWRMAAAATGSLTLARASYCATLLTGGEDGTEEMPVAVAPSLPIEPAADGTPLAADGTASAPETDPALHFKFVAASPGQEFVVGQVLPYGKGACWRLLEGSKDVFVEDVANEPAIHFLSESNRHGSYYAVPICDAEGRVLGFVALDTLVPEGGVVEVVSEEDRAYLRAIAEAIQVALAAQRERCLQMAEAGETAAAAAAGDAEGDEDAMLEEAREHADLSGGRHANQLAVVELTALTEPDMTELAVQPDPGTVAWAVMKTAVALLGVAGESHEEDWATIQQHVNTDLVAAAIDFDPEGNAGRWPRVRAALRDVLGMKDSDVQAEMTAVKAFHRWLQSVKKISAGIMLERALQRRMERMRKAIQAAFVDSRSSALPELKSYRVAPRASFAVLRAVLLCLGHREEEFDSWAAARRLINHALVTALLAAKPRKMSRKMQAAINSALKGVTEAEVKKESAAAFLLYKWVEVVLQMGSAQQDPAKETA